MEDEINRTCNLHGRGKNTQRIVVGKRGEKKSPRRPRDSWGMLLKWVLNTWDEMV
jgi:hypothetical protein